MKALAAAIVILLLPVIYMAVTGDYPGSNWFYGIEEDSPVVDFILTITNH